MLGLFGVRRKAKRDFNKDEVGINRVQDDDDAINGFFVCSYFRKRIDNFHKYCSKKKQKVNNKRI